MNLYFLKFPKSILRKTSFSKKQRVPVNLAICAAAGAA
jgi:hypothetical protein